MEQECNIVLHTLTVIIIIVGKTMFVECIIVITHFIVPGYYITIFFYKFISASKGSIGSQELNNYIY